MNEESVARGLGWFSIGLGIAGLAAPRQVAQVTGLRGDQRTQAIARLVGARELVSGVGILTRRRPKGWLWWRVAQDAMDLALMSTALAMDPPRRDRVLATTTALVGVTALDTWCAVRLSAGGEARAGRRAGGRDIEAERAITVLKPTNEVYRFWRDFGNLPRFMNHLDSVEVLSGDRSHWKANAPAGTMVEWDAELVEDRPNELIAWRSLPGAAVENSGSVRFAPAPGGRGTEIRVDLRYDAPAGALGAAIAKLFGEEPSQQVLDDLRRLKQVLETGQVTFSDATVKGRGPAQPPAEVPPKSSDETGTHLATSGGARR